MILICEGFFFSVSKVSQKSGKKAICCGKNSCVPYGNVDSRLKTKSSTGLLKDTNGSLNIANDFSRENLLAEYCSSIF